MCIILLGGLEGGLNAQTSHLGMPVCRNHTVIRRSFGAVLQLRLSFVRPEQGAGRGLFSDGCRQTPFRGQQPLSRPVCYLSQTGRHAGAAENAPARLMLFDDADKIKYCFERIKDHDFRKRPS